jgi:hypothetical protein
MRHVSVIKVGEGMIALKEGAFRTVMETENVMKVNVNAIRGG